MTYSSSQYIDDNWAVSDDFQPPQFTSWSEVENMTAEMAQGIYIEAGRQLEDNLRRQMHTHFHPGDDCGDDLEAATTVWYKLQQAWFNNDGLTVGATVEVLRELVETYGGVPTPLLGVLIEDEDYARRWR